MDQFFAACTNCKVDHVAIHWYACTRQALQTYVAKFKKYNKPLWVTEFDCADQGTQPVEVQRAYLRDALSYLEGETAVFRYAWFSGRTTEVANVDLLGGAGQLTLLGQDYVSAAPVVSCQR
jgi:O-glycosyl hydrolase